MRADAEDRTRDFGLTKTALCQLSYDGGYTSRTEAGGLMTGLSHEIGNQTTGQVLAGLLRQGRSVLLPFGDGHRYDLAFDEGGRLVRVQCKTGRVRAGAVRFSTASKDRASGTLRRHYRGDVDFFGVYCPTNRKVYLVPVDQVGDVEAHLRLVPALNAQSVGVRVAAEFEI
jgi:PD-(D/E)XK endonuclease